MKKSLKDASLASLGLVYMRPRISIIGSVRRSVRRSVGPLVSGSRFRQKRENRCSYVIIQSFHHEDASLALRAFLLLRKVLAERMPVNCAFFL